MKPIRRFGNLTGIKMARINIEERFWTDPRLFELSKKMRCQWRAIGQCAKMWSVAQELYAEKKPFTELIFKYHKFSEHLITCGFIERVNGELLVKGREENFIWLRESRDAGKRGGSASAKSRHSCDTHATLMRHSSELHNKINNVVQPSSSSSSSSNIINKKVEYTSQNFDNFSFKEMKQKDFSRLLDRVAKKMVVE